jgi:hypothetical protein
MTTTLASAKASASRDPRDTVERSQRVDTDAPLDYAATHRLTVPSNPNDEATAGTKWVFDSKKIMNGLGKTSTPSSVIVK